MGKTHQLASGIFSSPRQQATLRFSEHLEGNGPDIFRHACAIGLEGIVSKRRDSRYRSGRSLKWVKLKNPEYERPGTWDSLKLGGMSMNDDGQRQMRTMRELLSRLRERRDATINELAEASFEGRGWMDLVTQLRAIQDAIDLVKGAQGDEAAYRPVYEGER